MTARQVAPHIREIQILGDQKALRRLHRVPHIKVGTAIQLLRTNRVHVVTENGKGSDEAVRQIFVEFDGHRLTGVSASGRSS